MSEDLTRPPLKKKFGTFEIKLTYGLQLDLQRMIPDPTEVMNLLINDPYLRDWIIRRVLTDKASSVTEEAQLISYEEITLDPDEILDLLDWVSGHLMYFFGKSAAKATRLGEQYKDQLAQLIPSSIGSTDSLSLTESAGPSDASKETSTSSTGDTPSGS